MTTTRTSPWKYLGYLIFPILDDETEQVIFYDIHEPGECSDDDPTDSYADLDQAREFIRRHNRDRKFIRALDRMTF